MSKLHTEAVAQMSSAKKVLSEILQNSRENTCARVSFVNKVAGLRSATLFKKWHWRRCFPVNFVKFLRKPFLIEHLPWLLLLFLSVFLLLPIRFILRYLPGPLLYSEVLFLFSILYSGTLFYKKKKEKKKIFIEDHKKYGKSQY